MRENEIGADLCIARSVNAENFSPTLPGIPMQGVTINFAIIIFCGNDFIIARNTFYIKLTNYRDFPMPRLNR